HVAHERKRFSKRILGRARKDLPRTLRSRIPSKSQAAPSDPGSPEVSKVADNFDGLDSYTLSFFAGPLSFRPALRRLADVYRGGPPARRSKGTARQETGRGKAAPVELAHHLRCRLHPGAAGTGRSELPGSGGSASQSGRGAHQRADVPSRPRRPADVLL